MEEQIRVKSILYVNQFFLMTNKQQNDTIPLILLQIHIDSDNLLQKNLYTWREEKVDEYCLRQANFTFIDDVLNQIKQNSYNQSDIFGAIDLLYKIFNSVRNEFQIEYSLSDVNRRKEIVEKICLPYVLILRFLNVKIGNKYLFKENYLN